MLHTVVHGWRSNRKNPYRNIISRSMMKFQGKQTVNNLLVSTVLIAGACFAIFYIPMLGVGQLVSVSGWEFDYMYDYRLDQTVPSPNEIEEIAAGHDLVLKDWKEIPYITSPKMERRKLKMRIIVFTMNTNSFYVKRNMFPSQRSISLPDRHWTFFPELSV